MANQYKQKYDIQDMRVLAKKRNGTCNSTIYVNNKTKLEWQCFQGHSWSAEPRAIMAGQWCPICSSGLGERICRLVFEEIFGKQFIKCRPIWLKSKVSKYSLELDGYCEELGLAFEYNGHQHYGSSPVFISPTYDNDKHKLCQDYGIKLFTIPETNRTPTIEYIKELIAIQCKDWQINADLSISIDVNKAYHTSKDSEELDRVKKQAILMGGKCLSDVYLGCHERLLFQCGNCNHSWQATPRDINSGSWCHRCAGRAYTMDDAIELATIKNGKCLSSQFKNATSKMSWECDMGHTWETSFHQIKRGTWCPKCFRLKTRKVK